VCNGYFGCVVNVLRLYWKFGCVVDNFFCSGYVGCVVDMLYV